MKRRRRIILPKLGGVSDVNKMGLKDNAFMKRTYFTLPYIYLYSLILAALDSFAGRNSGLDPYNFETFCMRALVIFTYCLIVRLVAERAERYGRSYKTYMFLTAGLIPTIAFGLAFLLTFLNR